MPIEKKRGPGQGRPKHVFTEEQLASIETLSGYGLSLRKIAAVLRIGHATLERHMHDPEVKEAVERGKGIAEADIIQTAHRMAKRDPSMTRFWLQCRANWKTKSVVENVGHNGGPIHVKEEKLSDEELEKKIRELRDKDRLLDGDAEE